MKISKITNWLVAGAACFWVPLVTWILRSIRRLFPTRIIRMQTRFGRVLIVLLRIGVGG